MGSQVVIIVIILIMIFLIIIIMKFSGHIVYNYDFYDDFAEIDCEISFKCILGVFDFASSPFYCKCDFIHV